MGDHFACPCSTSDPILAVQGDADHLSAENGAHSWDQLANSYGLKYSNTIQRDAIDTNVELEIIRGDVGDHMDGNDIISQRICYDSISEPMISRVSQKISSTYKQQTMTNFLEDDATNCVTQSTINTNTQYPFSIVPKSPTKKPVSPKVTATNLSQKRKAAKDLLLVSIDTARERKIAHNAIEKRYRSNMNLKFTSLNNAVPDVFKVSSSQRDNNSQHSYQPHKSEILVDALAYIHLLEEDNYCLLQQIAVLQSDLT